MKIKEIGQGLVEYALFLVIIVAIITAILTALGFTEDQIATIICSMFGICTP
jgi:hypothetical protein